MASWKLTSDFNSQKHLFFKKVQTDYLIDTFICSCSYVECVVKHPGQVVNYRCPKCENDMFHDANRALGNIENFMDENFFMDLPTEYISRYDDDKISSHYILKVPKSIDFLKKTASYEDQIIYSLTLKSDGELEGDIYEEDIPASPKLKEPSEQAVIAKKLIETLTKQINIFCYGVPKPKDKELSISQARLFLIYRHLKEFDFYYWEQRHELPARELYIEDALAYIINYRKEKSVKKALYENYARQLEESSEFNSFLIQAFSKNIEDANLVVTFLKYNFDYPKESGIHADELDLFIKFLKQHYSEKQILKFFMDYDGDTQEYLFRDIVSDLAFNFEAIDGGFKKTACKMRDVHDEFVRCVSEERYKHIYKKSLFYPKKELKPCVSTGSYSVRLPHSGKELFEWAEELHNCMSGYFDWIARGETIIYGFFQNGTLLFAVEIQNGRMVQYSAKRNAKLNEDELKLLEKWYGIYFENALDEAKNA